MLTLESFKKEFDVWARDNGEAFFLNGSHPWLSTYAAHMVNNGGKRFRPYLYYYFLKSKKNYFSTAYLIEALHTATLIIDDIQDHAETRRGKKSLHRKVSVPLALNIGLAMLFSHAPTRSAEEQAAINRCLLTLCLGQGDEMQLSASALSDQKRWAILDAYDKKTSALFVLCYELAQITNGQPIQSQVVTDLTLFGRSFQARDDAADLSTGEDLQEKKITLPLFFLAQKPNMLHTITAYLNDEVGWQEIQSKMKSHHIAQETTAFAAQCLAEIKSPLVRALVERLQ